MSPTAISMVTGTALILCIVFIASSTSARIVNMTRLANCDDHGTTIPVYLISVSYDRDPATGICNTIHAKFNSTTEDKSDAIWKLYFYRCPAGDAMLAKCDSNPTVHEEAVNCKRFIEDDSGPWHFFASAMNGKCGHEIGTFALDYQSLRMENLINYLDVTDSKYSRFHLKMEYKNGITRNTRACAELDFNLV